MSTTILFYTNNLLPPKLLESTLSSAINFCKDSDNEIVITSHFPITKKYETIDLADNKEDHMYTAKINLKTNEARLSHVYKHLVKSVSVETEGIKCQSYVTDKMPYTHKSIFKQISYSLSKASYENVVFMEHDCFYPLNYLEGLEKARNECHCDFQYAYNNACYMDYGGYFKADTRFMLSGCSGKRDYLKAIFDNKLQLIKDSKQYYFEPLLKECTDEMKEKYSGEILVDNYVCADRFLGENHDVLDIKHKLNQAGQLHVLRNTAGWLKNCRHIDEHPYWGSPKKYLDMIDFYMDKESEAETMLGTRFF